MLVDDGKYDNSCDKLYEVYFLKYFFRKTSSHNLSPPSDILVLLTLLLFYNKKRKENSKLVTKYDSHFWRKKLQ